MASVISLFKKQVDKNQDKLLYAFLNLEGKITERYTYIEFLQRTGQIASYIHQAYQLKPGDRVLLAYPPGLEMICAFFACIRLGLIPVPVYPPSSQGFQAALYKMTFIAKDCGAVAVLTDRNLYWSVKMNIKKNQFSNLSFKREYLSTLKWIISDDSDASIGHFPEAHSDILFLQYTSGSTSNPKGVMVSHKNIVHNCEMVVDHLPIGVSWLPQYHDMGLIGYYLFFALKGGTTYGFSPIDFIQRPSLWLQTISQYRGTASSAPNFAYEYCLRPDKIPAKTFDNLDLSSLKFLMTAAEPVRPNTYRAFIKKFEPYGLNPKNHFSAYGLAEFTLAVSNYGKTIRSFNALSLNTGDVQERSQNDLATQATELVSVGKPLGDTEIKIVDMSKGFREATSECVGEIWIDGSSKCMGYWNKPELSAEIFQAKGIGSLSSKSWLRTGDLGFMRDGELYVCGRVKDMIIIRGQNYYPQDVERIIEEEPSIRKGCVAAFSVEEGGSEKLIVVAELKNKTVQPDSEILNARIHRYLDLTVYEVVYIRARTIPKTSSGKIARHQAKKLYIDGGLQTIDKVRINLKSLSHVGQTANHQFKLNGDSRYDLEMLFRKHGMHGTEKGTLIDTGLDSLKLAEFVADLKKYLSHHGYHDLIETIDLRLIQKINVDELFNAVHDLSNSSSTSKFRFRRAFEVLKQERRQVEQHWMRKDCLPAMIERRQTKAIGQKLEGGHILLTGGTGFFGPFLLKSLLEQNLDDIYVLVRADDAETGINRLLESFASIEPDATLLTTFHQRVKPIVGNLSYKMFGLSPEKWNFLTQNIHTIFHNGAYVNYLFDYESMRSANIGGTHEVINLAWTTRPKVVNHISTTFTFGWSVKENLFESDDNDNLDLLDFGYSQTKWVSEQLIKHEIKQGLQARIFRPALISPSIDGAGHNPDISIRLLAFMLKYGIGTSAKNQVSFTPADIAANNIIAVSNILESAGHTFHVTRDEYSSMLDVTSILSDLTGKKFENFDLKNFVPEVVSRCQKEDSLFPLLDFLVRSADKISSMEFKRYDNTNYRKYCNQSAWSKSDPSLESVVSGILRFMKSQNLVDSHLTIVANA